MSKWGIAAVSGWLVVLALGCSREEQPGTETPMQQPERLVRVEDEPRGAQCPLGGTVILTGLDVNQDGVLADEEVVETRYACQKPGQQARLVPEPEGEHCAHGGMALLSGPDANGNGVLDPAEVTQTEYLCHEAAPTALLRIEAEAPGSHCPGGGRRVLNGLDLNRDGVLGDEEILTTQYVCETRELVRVDAVRAGTHCPGDGAAVNSGPDTNGDGVLQDSEVTKTEYVCDRVILGNVTVNSQLELLALADVAVITGDLDISYTDKVVNVDLPALKHVGGDLELHYLRELRNVSLPALERVGGSIKLSSLPKVDRLDLRAVRNIGLDLRVAENPELVAMDFTSLQILSGSVWVQKNPKLAVLGLSSLRWADELILWNVATSRIELPQLQNVRALSIADGTSTELHLPALVYVRDDIVIAGMARLQRLELPVLYSVGKKFIVRDTQVLDAFSLPNLQELPGDFDLWSNAGLTTFDVPKLQSIGGWLYVSDNDALTTLSGLQNVGSVGGMLMLYGNARLTSPEGLAALRSVGSYIQVERSGFTDFHLPSLSRAWIIIIGSLGNENQQLKSIRLPGLGMASALTLVGNPLLDSLDLPAARLITDSLFISFTPKLASCRVEALLGNLRAPPINVELYDLDTRPICQ